MDAETTSKDMDIKLLKARIDFLEAQLSAIKRDLETPKLVRLNKNRFNIAESI